VKRRISWSLLANGAACILPLVLAVVIKRYTLPVPYWDEWAWAPLIYRMHSGVLRFGDLWQQHNEYRMLFPNVIALGLASLGGWNELRETLFSLLLVVLTQIGAYVLLRRVVRRERLPFAFLAASLLLYCLAQMDSWDWGFQMTVFLCNASAVWALLFLGTTGQSWFALIAAMVLALIASCSAFGGLMAWVGGIFTLLLAEKRRPGQIAAWILGALVVYLAYFRGYVQPEGGFEALFGLRHPLAAVRNLGTGVGAVFGGWLGVGPALAIGWLGIGLLLVLLGVVVNEYRLERRSGARAASLVGIAAYALSAVVVSAAGSARFGPAQAGGSPDVSIALYCWIVDCALLFAYWDRVARRWPRPLVRLGQGAAVILAALYVGSSYAGLQLGSDRLARVSATFPALAAGAGPELTQLFSSAPALEEYLRELKSVKDGPYYE
jgi:hypothetical protein